MRATPPRGVAADAQTYSFPGKCALRRVQRPNAGAEANQAARDSSRFADEAATQADELEEKLTALATTMEVHVMNKLEGKLRAIGDASEAQYEAAKAMMSGAGGLAVNTTIVDCLLYTSPSPRDRG